MGLHAYRRPIGKSRTIGEGGRVFPAFFSLVWRFLRASLPSTRVNRGSLLVRPLALVRRLGAQPQRDVFGLHGAPGYPDQVVA